jgi:hypothetical protein
MGIIFRKSKSIIVEKGKETKGLKKILRRIYRVQSEAKASVSVATVFLLAEVI